MFDTVQQRIAEHHVRMGHVDLGAEHLLAVSIFAGLHLAEEPEVLLDAAVAVGAFDTGLVHGTAMQPDFFLGLVINIGQSPLDQLFGPLVKLVEIVGCIQFLIPLESQPLDVLLDGIYIFDIFLDRVGIVVTEVGLTAIFLRQTEIQANALGMSQMQVAVRLRRETRHDALDLAGRQV